MNKNITKILIIAFIFFIGIGFGIQVDNYFNGVIADDLSLDDQEATIRAIKKVSPAVVSIIVYNKDEFVNIDLTTEQKSIYKEDVQKGSGTGFIISADGLIITNKHVINIATDETASYKIILNNGQQYYAQLIGRDPLNDLAVLKIFDKNLPYVELGNSDDLQIGTTVITIGNVLGRYQNSVTKGIVSGLGRSLVASDQTGNSEALDNVIQTDAEINLGNSGGPLINLAGKVIGINVANDSGGESIGFAIPINDVRAVINSVREKGLIIRPRLGVRYVMLTPELASDYKLARETGAYIVHPIDNSAGVLPGSPAGLAGLLEGDIIFEINAIKLEKNNTLISMIQRYKPGDRIGMKVQRGEKVMIKIVTLDKF